MLGRHSPQGDLFRPDNIHLDRVGRESIYSFLAQQRHRLFRDKDFADLSKKDWGRPSVPPFQLCIALILQAKDGVSDDEAILRSAFESSIAACRRAGLLKKKRLEVALDTTPVFGRGAVKDTFDLLSAKLLA